VSMLANPSQLYRSCHNKLLRAMPAADLEVLLPFLEAVEVKSGCILHHAHVPISHFYFIETGLVSIEAEAEHHKWTEVWQVGNEGCLGLPLVVGRESLSYRRVVLVDGRALRIPHHEFQAKTDEIAALRKALLQYLFVVLLQTSRLNACNLRHSVNQRAARWLLLACYRYRSPYLPIKQSVLGRVLGIRRASVSTCLGEFKQLGCVNKERGTIVVTNLVQLERISCACYGLIRREIEGRTDSLTPVLTSGENDIGSVTEHPI
jgi:CRP-like cAMP-binding protein